MNTVAWLVLKQIKIRYGLEVQSFKFSWGYDIYLHTPTGEIVCRCVIKERQDDEINDFEQTFLAESNNIKVAG